MEHIVDKNNMFDFLLAGHCECSIKNEETGNHFTYKILKAKTQKSRNSVAYFVKVAYDYDTFFYAGMVLVDLNGQIRYYKGESGGAEADSQSIRVLMYVLKHAKAGDLPNQINAYHFGRCAHCGRVLEDPESIVLGLGPKCRKMVGA